MELDVLSKISEQEFVEEYIKKNKPVVIRDVNFEIDKWTPDFFKALMGDLSVQVYGTLFALQEISTLSNYIDRYFGNEGNADGNTPYVRWYNKMKAIDYVWADEAFGRLSRYWQKPPFLPDSRLLVPVASEHRSVNPVVDNFPYRGILVAARGARTRLHRDPFCSDAVVSQFYGVKEVVMYHPGREVELTVTDEDSTSYGGFVDVRGNAIDGLSHEPDYHGFLGPGEVLYVPHGWLHDVLVKEDSISVTWNFIHENGALEFIDYLMDGPEKDSEFEVLRYFYSLAGENVSCASDIIERYSEKFLEIEEAFAE